MFVPWLEPVKCKKSSILEKIKFYFLQDRKKSNFIFCKVLTMANILRIQKKNSENQIFDGAEQ